MRRRAKTFGIPVYSIASERVSENLDAADARIERRMNSRIHLKRSHQSEGVSIARLYAGIPHDGLCHPDGWQSHPQPRAALADRHHRQYSVIHCDRPALYLSTTEIAGCIEFRMGDRNWWSMGADRVADPLFAFLCKWARVSFRSDLSRLTRGDLAELFTAELVASLMFAFLFWILVGRFLDALDQIGLDQILASQPGPGPIQSETVPAHQRLVSLTFSTGIGLVILTALARLDYNTIVSNVEGIPAVMFNRFSGGEAGALLYFIFGLALLSLSRLMTLQTHWNQLRIPVSSKNLYRQWGMYSLFFLFDSRSDRQLITRRRQPRFFLRAGYIVRFSDRHILLYRANHPHSSYALDQHSFLVIWRQNSWHAICSASYAGLSSGSASFTSHQS